MDIFRTLMSGKTIRIILRHYVEHSTPHGCWKINLLIAPDIRTLFSPVSREGNLQDYPVNITTLYVTFYPAWLLKNESIGCCGNIIGPWCPLCSEKSISVRTVYWISITTPAVKFYNHMVIGKWIYWALLKYDWTRKSPMFREVNQCSESLFITITILAVKAYTRISTIMCSM
jgi:hypothetical protein